MFEDIPTIERKTNFVVSNSRALRRDMDLDTTEDKQWIRFYHALEWRGGR